ncbi:MAG: response regulator [Deltaproteobacteria bacterium]|nr:response regulator [Deltaproteobacteria bacterium]MBW1845964.1 response regulator [Deltaproteobacteria bacterium]MBW2181434.1 response regulator [Deltaproteobacteria bacterium]MBW2365389.1 response regulator [Deltaproteobacteria bacterium]
MKNTQKPRILIAEDDYLVSEAIKHGLKGLGYELEGEVSDGKKAVEMACTGNPDVILMDIEMPKLDGLEAARQIQARCPKPVIILTAHESQELVEKAREVGVSAYLIKPPKPAEIDRAIIIALSRHEDLMKLRRLNEELEKALSEIKILKGIIPICANCKKIRDDKGYWNQIEAYIRDHSEAEFSHGICPECSKELYPDLKIHEDE